MCNRLLTACSHFAMRLTLMCLSLLLTAAFTQAQTFSVLHSFTGGADGSHPLAGVAMDRSENLYGTASLGGRGFGTVYKLAPQGRNWTVNPLYQFRGAPDGFYPEAGVTIAPDGSLYGTTFYGGESATGCLQGATETCGTAFHLQPPATVCPSALCPWIETQIYLFHTPPSFSSPTLANSSSIAPGTCTEQRSKAALKPLMAECTNFLPPREVGSKPIFMAFQVTTVRAVVRSEG